MKKIKASIIALSIAILLNLTSTVSPLATEGKITADTVRSNIFEKDQILDRISTFFKLIPFPKIPLTLGERPLLLILIEFSDFSHNALHDPEYFDQLLWGERPSVQDYYLEMSYGKFTFVKAGILGWYKSSQSISQKSRNDIVKDAYMNAAANSSFHFAHYDKNEDGILTTDELTIIICTSGESIENPMGAYHNWYLPGGKIKTWDEMIIDKDYSVVQEWHSTVVFAHELGHSLLLPDLYDYKNNSRGIGLYGLEGLIGLNGETAPHFTAWSKIKLGWIEPTIVTTDGFYTIYSVETHAEAYILKDSHHSKKEYFLIENRFVGSSYENSSLPLPDEGILIYHIDENIPRWYAPRIWFPHVDNIEQHKMIDVECADSPTSHFKNADDLDKNINSGDKNDLWDKTEYGFNSTSNPCKSVWYDGSSNKIGVYVISEPGENMTVYLSVNGTNP
jgi:M6 family metalloprotease-like protein